MKRLIMAGGLTALSFSALTGQAQTRRLLLDQTNMDLSVKPGDNFYRYANGSWLKNTPIPPSETRWGSFNELIENNYQALHALLDSAANAHGAHGSADQKIGDFYRSGMDTVAIESAGIKPLAPDFVMIDKIGTPTQLMKEIAYLHTIGLGSVFNFGVSPDDKHVSNMICQFYQGGLGMPDRDYYTKQDDRSKKLRAAYVQYLTTLFNIMGDDDQLAGTHATQVMALETALAEASMTRVEMRDPYKTYNKMSVKDLAGKMQTIGWSSLMTDLAVPGQDSIIIGQPGFFDVLNKQLSATPLDVWKAYLKVHLLSDLSPYLSSNADQAHFQFYGVTLRGQQVQKARWKRVLQVIDGSIGELLGQAYVSKNFKPEAKTRMLSLVNNLQQTYADRITRLDWMSDATKKKAMGKLNAFMKKIGYPDKWRDYSALNITTNFVANIKATSAFEYQYMVHKLGRPVDRTEWGMTPPTVNAYYNPAFNEIVFPAGILQYPFFDFSADDAINYGGIGAVIGHEMTHGFDDQGRLYDADGNLADWWTKEDADQFTSKAKVVINQFNGYTVLDTMHVNGELTIGENLADLGGINIAYEAFMKTEQAKSGRKRDGFTPEQRFFLSWAQVWRANTRPEETASRIVTDPHSPGEFRCNGPLSNMPEFYQAFDVKPGDKMYREPADRAKVW